MQDKKSIIQISLNPKIYPLKVIYAACYVFIDRCYFFLDGDPKKEIKVSMSGKKRFTQKESEALPGEFQNELLHQALRAKIAESNQQIREYVVSKALFSADPDLEQLQELLGNQEALGVKLDIDGEFESDPLGIAVPWEEQDSEVKGKNAKTKKK